MNRFLLIPYVCVIYEVHISTNVFFRSVGIRFIERFPIRQNHKERIGTTHIIACTRIASRSIYHRSVICCPVTSIIFLALIRFECYFPQTFFIIKYQLRVVLKHLFVTTVAKVMITFSFKCFPFFNDRLEITLSCSIIRTSQLSCSSVQAITCTLQIHTHQ